AESKFYGGDGDDVIVTGHDQSNLLVGGPGKDSLYCNTLGADTIGYANAAESSSTTYDIVHGFETAHDHFDLWTNVVAVDPAITSGTLSSNTFDADLANAMGGL